MPPRAAATAFLLACLAAWPTSGQADTWQTRVLVDGTGITGVTLGRIKLQLMCQRGAEREIASLIAASGFPRHLFQESPVTLEIEMPKGGVRRHTAYMVLDADGRTLIGSIPLASGFLEDFGNGSALRIITNGKVMIRSGLRGTGKARSVFREVCGL
ncbi:MAG: hypothetical protein AAFN05_09210 [Pseudomonadota bacterium]